MNQVIFGQKFEAPQILLSSYAHGSSYSYPVAQLVTGLARDL